MHRQSRSFRVYGSWVLPFVAMGLGDDLSQDHSDSGRYLALAFALGAMAGLLWQMAYRRDLADRLVFMSGLFALLVFVGAMANLRWELFSSQGSEFAAVGVLVGLVFAEQGLRWNDHRRDARRRPTVESRQDSRV